jgi:hypothetical protein
LTVKFLNERGDSERENASGLDYSGNDTGFFVNIELPVKVNNRGLELFGRTVRAYAYVITVPTSEH